MPAWQTSLVVDGWRFSSGQPPGIDSCGSADADLEYKTKRSGIARQHRKGGLPPGGIEGPFEAGDHWLRYSHPLRYRFL